jgi:hypothetical protein
MHWLPVVTENQPLFRLEASDSFIRNARASASAGCRSSGQQGVRYEHRLESVSQAVLGLAHVLLLRGSKLLVNCV